MFARDLLATLREHEVSATLSAIAGKTGLEHHPVAEGEPVAGLYIKVFCNRQRRHFHLGYRTPAEAEADAA